MSQIVKPDRPIWPPVPERVVPPRPESQPSEPQRLPPKSTKRDAALGAALHTESDAKVGPSAFEGFGSFSG